MNKRTLAAATALLLAALATGPASASTRRANTVAKGSVTLIDTQTNTRGATVPVGKFPSEIVLSPDGKTAYVLNTVSNSVSLVSRASGVLTSRTIKAGRYPVGIAMTPSGNRVFITRQQNYGPGSVLPVKAASGVPGTPVSPLRQQGYIVGPVVAAPDGRHVYAEEVGLMGPWVALLPIRTAGDRVGSPIKFGRFPYGIVNMAFTPDSRTLFVLSTTSKQALLTPIRISTGKVGRSIALPAIPSAMAMTPNGRLIYIANTFHGIVTVVRTGTDSVIKRIKVNFAQSLGMAPDGKTIYVGGAAPDTGAGEVIPVNTATNTAGQPITVSPDSDVTAIVVTPDGSTAYAALGADDEVAVIDTATRAAGTVIPVGVHPALLAMSRDGGTLFVVNSPDQS